jgi:uncharacterized protein (DUF2236 family)/outer membrane biogenesis lipoprotein LolB
MPVSFRILFLGLLLVLGGCANNPLVKGAAIGNKELDVWVVEGNIRVKGEAGWQKMNFTWTQRGDQFAVDFREKNDQKNTVLHYQGGAEKIVASGPWAEGEEAVQAPDIKSPKLNATLPLAYFSTWLLGRSTHSDALIKKGEHAEIKSLREGGWLLKYKDWRLTADYRIPREIFIKGHGSKIEMTVLRAETAFVDGCCDDGHVDIDEKATEGLSDSWAAMSSAERGKVETPKDLLVDDDAFRAQLIKLHGKIPDAKNGLYGPDSMMWKVLKYVSPPAFGAGRALLLQLAHPWVTASIDEHSKVRRNPFERGRRTFHSLLAMVYGTTPQAFAAAAKVRMEHDRIYGKMKYDAGAFKQDTDYHANEINAMIWVYATLWDTVITMYEQIEKPLTQTEKEQFYEETKLFAMLFGIPMEALPKDWDAFVAYNRDMWASPQLTITPATKDLAKFVMSAQNVFLILPMWVQRVFASANLPPRLREQYGMHYGIFTQASYEGMLFGLKIADRLAPKTFRYNPAYNQAMDRLSGKECGYIVRKLMRIGTGREDVVN